MKNWLKQQVTEFTAWMGFGLIIFAFIMPRWFLALLGVLLIAVDDKSVSGFVATRAPWLQRKIDEVDEGL